MKLENAGLSETSQSEKGKYCKRPHIRGTLSCQTHRDRKLEQLLLEAGGRGNGDFLSIGYRVSILQDEKSFGDWLCNGVNVLSTPGMYTQKWSYVKYYII